MEGVGAAVERLWPGRRTTVTVLGGGITNHNFKIEVDGVAYVLRMGGAKTGLLGIDRAVEHAASLRAEEIGVGPPVADFVASEGWLVTRFIEGRPIPVEEMRLPSTLSRVAVALRTLHSARAIPGRFDAHAVVDEYRAEAEANGVQIPKEFARAREVAERIRVARGPQPLVPCHNDLLNANFLDDGAIRIVDWEYAGMGDRFFDLANFSVNHEFGVNDDQRFLAAYFGTERDSALASLRLMRFMSDFREAMWGVLQSGISELDFDFDGYAAKHFDRMEKTAGDSEFAGYLGTARDK
ncbi:MAG: phosphotransferase [Candidatus Dormibacteraceae bacterium]